MSGLAHLRVLELGGGITAALAARLLADLGASCVKVEPPGGDPARQWGPFRAGRADPEASGTFLFLNANKRSLVLDLAGAADRSRLEALVAEADLLVHDLPPREMAAQGIAFDRFERLNPRLVMLSLTPFGQSGPHRDYAGNDLTLMHGGGWGTLSPGKSAPRELPPLRPFGHHALAQAALHGTVAALAACFAARETGRGEHVDVSIHDVVATLTSRNFANYTYMGKVDRRDDPTPYEPYGFYLCNDGYLFMICAEQPQWERLVELMGSPAWAADPRFLTRDLRGRHVVELKTRISAWSKGWTVSDLFHACQKARVGAAPVYTFAQIEREPHLLERGAMARIDHPVAGPLTLPGAPYRLKHPWWSLRTPAPRLGEAGGPGKGEPARLFPPRRFPLHNAPGASTAAAKAGGPPLAGVRVLDLSWVWAGPHATTMLAFLGAEVIKVESSKRLDLTRRSTPYPTGMTPGINRTGYFNIINQAKLSIGVDLSRPEGIALVRQLATRCDVVISNFGTGVAERLGVGAEEMLKLNPSLTIAMISAFGQTGPYRNYMGYGPLISPLAGLSVQTAYREDGEPRDVGMPYGDPNGGIHAALAIAAALCARQADGTGGQVIDLSMWECMLGLTYEGWMNHVLGNPPYPPMGNRDPFHAPHNVYACRGDDQWVALAVTEERQWPALCRAVGRPDLAADPRFAERAARKANEDALDALLAAWCRDRDRWAITEALQAEGVAAYPCLTTKDLAESPQLEARGALTRWPHAEVGVQTLLGAPWRLTRRPNGVGCAAPLLGQHTDDVLGRILGLDAARRAELRAQGIVE